MGALEAARARQSRQLADGRVLGFAEYGDPAGDPVFYFHGWPGSRIEARLLAPVACLLRARVIAPDRPGYGLSSERRRRTIGDGSNDVQELADTLGLERFAVLGVSGGGLHALACAARLRQRVSRAAIVCGVGPLAHAPITAGMPFARRIACSVLRRAPFLARPLCYLSTWTLRRDAAAALEGFFTSLPAPDTLVLDQPAVRDALVASFAEAFCLGIGGASRDLQLWFQPWDFALREITAAVTFWHGERDVLVPAASSRHLAELLPGSRLNLLPEAGHYSLPLGEMKAILGDLLQRSLGD